MALRKHIRMGILFLLFLACPAALQAQTDEALTREYKIKAAYIYNLLKFVNWPEGSEIEALSTRICILKQNPFDGFLDALTEREVRGRSITVSYLDELAPDSGCSVLFIGQEVDYISGIMEDIRDSNMLTVGEESEFLAIGGIVALVVTNNNVQLEINLTQAKRNGFEISGNLLEIAKSIK